MTPYLKMKYAITLSVAVIKIKIKCKNLTQYLKIDYVITQIVVTYITTNMQII